MLINIFRNATEAAGTGPGKWESAVPPRGDSYTKHGKGSDPHDRDNGPAC